MPVKENTLQKFQEQIQITPLQLDYLGPFCRKRLKWPCLDDRHWIIPAFQSLITELKASSFLASDNILGTLTREIGTGP